MKLDDNNPSTIVAQATASGQAGIGIVRISGNKALTIAKKMLKLTPKPRYAHYGSFFNYQDEMIDIGVAIFYPNPHSFTGEDVLELQAHGGTAVINSLINTTLSLGAVLAEAGEFSQRAFLNGKIDLVQAEAVADLIMASSEQGVQSALRSLTGVFSNKINKLVEKLTNLRILVEATIDFSDEDIDTSAINTIRHQLVDINQQLHGILNNAQEGRLLREGIHIVIIGKPNAGKSSLLNAMTQTNRAIVTDIAGTTRDLLQETIHINGIALHIVDTAGLRQSSNVIEQEGIRRAYDAIKEADCVLLVFDAKEEADLSLIDDEIKNKPLLLVKNKIDLLDNTTKTPSVDGRVEVCISAKYNIGLESLKEQLLLLVGAHNLGEHTVLARKRHIEALKEAQTHLTSANDQLSINHHDLLAEDLRLSANALGKITGQISADHLLGEIFSQFCIGK